MPTDFDSRRGRIETGIFFMDVTSANFSSTGPVRRNNEDFLGYWEPTDANEKLDRGVVAVIADGVGGHGNGEVASQLAVETAIAKFREFKPEASLNATLWQMFNAANVGVYNAGLESRTEEARMATTLSVAIFRNDQVGIGHVGDCRTYHIRRNEINCLTTDHTYVAFHVKMGLMSPEEAANSPMRGALTRSIGKDPIVSVDFYYIVVTTGDWIVQCTDGVYTALTEHEIMEIVTHADPADACKALVAKAEARGSEDNLSAQITRVNKVRRLTRFRGIEAPVKPNQSEPEHPMGHEVNTGDLLDDRFEIKDLISRSGMASIFKALDRKTNELVAIKIPFMQYESDPAFHSRFQREEEIGLTLNHPNLLKIIEVDKDKRSRPYIVMELLHGKTLDHVLRDTKPFEVEQAISTASKICGALTHMHSKGIVHRDLKPQNIMICEDGSLRIMDFGIAKAAGMRRLTFVGFSPTMGTPDYMAPEQVKGRRGDERTDIYSLGAILYELATGNTPFEGENPFLIMQARMTGDPKAPRSVNAKITPELEEIILHAMEREPNARFASAADMKAELDDPSKVKLTDRHAKLVEPSPWKAQWAAMRVNIILFSIVPALTLIALFIAWMVHHWKK